MAHNLPARLTSFVGREREIVEIGVLLEGQRLVTLVGAPGVGKTRLSLQVAANVLDRFSDGVRLVELAPLADPDLVPHAVAHALGVPEQPGRALTATLAEWLRLRRLLLVFDNCEHLIQAVATLIETLVRACPDLHVMATSREPLAIEGETVRRVPSLAVPNAEQARGVDQRALAVVARSEAVRLFVERAQAADGMFALTEANAPVVATVCARLDGIPLAIELAAARVRALSVEQIAARLDDRFRLLTGGSRTALPRQQTLRGAVDWSYDLLSEPERRLLRRLAVFAGGFTLEAADAVARAPYPPGPRPSSLDTLVGLVDKSLVQVDEDAETADGERRYRLLETFRQYGWEKLIEHGELEGTRDRHRDYHLALAEEIGAALNQRYDGASLDRLEPEHDNLRTALAWCLEEPGVRHARASTDGERGASSGAALGVRLAASIWRFWWLRGYLGEGRSWLARVLAAPASGSSPADVDARDLALLGISNLSAYLGDYRAAVTSMSEKLAFCRETGNDRGVVVATHRLGYYLMHLGELEEAARLCEEGVVLARRLGDRASLASALHTSGIVWYVLGRFEQSVALSEEAIDLLRAVGNVTVIAYALRSQGRATADLGDPVKATLLAEEGLRISREVGDRRGIAESYKDLGRFALLIGDVGRALDLLGMGITICQQMDERWLAAICITILAGVKIAQGTQTPRRNVAHLASPDSACEHLLDAARLFAAAEHLREPHGLELPSDVQTTYVRDVALLRERLGEAAFGAAWSEGRAMSFEQAVEYALALTAPPEPGAGGGPGPATAACAPVQPAEGDPEVERLTLREREVAVLVARGLTNRQMAEALVLSERTIDSHVRNIMGKLGFSSRSRIAAWAVQHGLADDR